MNRLKKLYETAVENQTILDRIYNSEYESTEDLADLFSMISTNNKSMVSMLSEIYVRETPFIDV